MQAIKVIRIGYWSNSIMNGAILDINGLCRTVMCGAHCGCSPVIMEVKKYEKNLLRHRPFKRRERQGR